MNVTDLLKKKLKADASYPYKFDRRAGHYYRTDQVTLQFPAGTSLKHMQEWVDFYVNFFAALNVSIVVTSMAGYDNGMCVVTGYNVERLTDLSTNGDNTIKQKLTDFSQRPPKDPNPVIMPPVENVILPAFVGVGEKIQLIAIPKTMLDTLSAKQLQMEK